MICTRLLVYTCTVNTYTAHTIYTVQGTISTEEEENNENANEQMG